MRTKAGWGRIVFNLFNYPFLIGLSILCILPLIHILALSFSSKIAAAAGKVSFWPIDFTTQSYDYVFGKPDFLQALVITLERVGIGTLTGMFLTVIIAYPLSKEAQAFRYRTLYVWFFVVTMLFHGGLIPAYMIVNMTGIMDTIWALVIPGAVNVFNCILMLNFFRGLPKELEEAAFVDGAGHWIVLWKLFIPLSLPVLATVTLFTIVSHWNSWFDGLIYMNRPENYPLQSYLHTVIIKQDLALLSANNLEAMALVSERTSKAAQIFMGAIPVLLVYPFLQKYFVKGIVLGSVKG
jgi:putative aldouronate transport system permease protein